MPTFDAEIIKNAHFFQKISKMPTLYDKRTITGFRKAADRRTTFLDPCPFLTFVGSPTPKNISTGTRAQVLRATCHAREAFVLRHSVGALRATMAAMS